MHFSHQRCCFINAAIPPVDLVLEFFSPGAISQFLVAFLLLRKGQLLLLVLTLKRWTPTFKINELLTFSCRSGFDPRLLIGITEFIKFKRLILQVEAQLVVILHARLVLGIRVDSELEQVVVVDPDSFEVLPN